VSDPSLQVDDRRWTLACAGASGLAFVEGPRLPHEPGESVEVVPASVVAALKWRDAEREAAFECIEQAATEAQTLVAALTEEVERLRGTTCDPGGEVCKSCGRLVAETCPTHWHAPDALWLEVEGGPGGIRCIPCFTRDAAAKGIQVEWRPLISDKGFPECWCTWDEIDGAEGIVHYHPRCPKHDDDAEVRLSDEMVAAVREITDANGAAAVPFLDDAVGHALALKLAEGARQERNRLTHDEARDWFSWQLHRAPFCLLSAAEQDCVVAGLVELTGLLSEGDTDA
jgi:hypothetical protein